MKFEIRRYYRRNRDSFAVYDVNASVPEREISDDESVQYMHLCEILNMKRHETKSQIYYDKVVDCHNIEEYIFYK